MTISEDFIAEMKREFPRFSIRYKRDSGLQRAIHRKESSICSN